MEAIKVILFIHVLSGFTALFCGLIASIAKKGRKVHVLSGRIYYYGMLGVFLTSTALFCLEGMRLLFLLLVGIFSFYFVHFGVRTLKIKNIASNVKWHDLAYVTLVLLSGLTMIVCSFLYNVHKGDGLGVLFLVFGALTLTATVKDLSDLLKLKYKGINGQHSVLMHVSRVGGGYIATVTAFLVTNIQFLPPLVVWIGPGVIGGIILSRVSARLKGKMKKTSKKIYVKDQLIEKVA